MPNTPTLRSALSVLSKSSPQAVEVEQDDADKNIYKQFLYITTEIEKDFSKQLNKLEPGEIIFLCGSSGDGKSAILTRYSRKLSNKIKFHLDATHSLDPHNNAISELDKLFSEVAVTRQPLVIGINVGMMGNYAEGGSEEHSVLKDSMRAHIQGNTPPSMHHYFDFERYPKFEFRDHVAHSNFAEAFMQRLTQYNDNPFIPLLEGHDQNGQEPVLCSNFKMLMLPSVQRVIVDALMKARLIKDQFMTSRALLDFLHHLLTSPNYLFDNLYAATDNELSQRIVGFDPANIRTKQIDHFILELKLELIDRDSEFNEFRNEIKKIGILNRLEPQSYIRLFHMLKGSDFANGYHQRFDADFSNTLLEQFARIWKLHDGYNDDSSKDDNNALQHFYSDVLLDGLRRYMNRRAPDLRRGLYFLAEYNQIKVVTALKIKLNFSAIADDRAHHSATFNAYMKVGGTALPALIIGINLYELLIKLKAGYRPNKHDKSTVLILDELVDQITHEANQESTLFFIDGTERYEVELDEGYLQVM
ncbi:DNA phosphorothioation-dependent restriction protein DptF [Neptunomonas qingdaonensis]|uniref:DNA phosphorothioation-dependent restriction protein DptF n=1 Tax=Neptunomonas qingdaonensis TaxID=1045558 RepID=A0A1I2U1N6_9GAMM|nr:DNA phosphorothioation-dependent restriction protein DptF [Neptunomonas qingdaonensis]SFG68806.1 DNA phosphorothioation-dependent restriction protein DptF [Neptunomonas qingdaonensis]